MAGFCVSCGAPLTGPFCNKCGAQAVPPGSQTPAATPPVPPSAPPAQAGFQPVNLPAPSPVQGGYQPVSAPVVSAPKSSGAGKILLWIGAVLLVLFMVGAGGAIYGFYWVKHKVSNFASEVTKGSSDSVHVVASGNNCSLLSSSELEKILGVTIEKNAEIEDGGQAGCAYYTNPTAVAQLQKMAMEQARRQSEEASKKPGPKGDNPLALLKDANQLEGIVKTLGMTQPEKNGQVFSFTLQRGVDADAWSGMRVTEAAVPGFEEVPGVGDHAMIGAFGHAFYVQKGDAIITMSMMLVPNARVRGTEIGRKIIGRL